MSQSVPSVPSTSDERTVNNVMRHAYRVLTDMEKQQMQRALAERKTAVSGRISTYSRGQHFHERP